MRDDLTAGDMFKLARHSAVFRNRIIEELSKYAKDDDKNSSRQFNETVPANEDQQGAEPDSGPQNNPESAAPNEYAAEPIVEEGGEAAAQEQDCPEAMGARAAQHFIGPEIMQAAMQGDPGAQEIIARAAGHIAGSVAEASARADSSTVEQGGGAEMPPDGAIPQDEGATVDEQGNPVSAVPEPVDELAGELSGTPPNGTVPGKVAQPAPQVNAKAAPVDESVDPETLKKIIALARAGKI